MKPLVWTTAALGTLSVLALVASRQREGTVLVNPPPIVAASAAPRCPDHTLEDNGVCLPLPRPQNPQKTAPTEWVAIEDQLSAFDVPWRDAPVPEALAERAPANFRALLVRTRVGSKVRCATTLPDPVITHVGKASETSWVLTVGSKSDATHTVSVANLTSLAAEANVGSACPTGKPLGTSGDTLVIWDGTH